MHRKTAILPIIIICFSAFACTSQDHAITDSAVDADLRYFSISFPNVDLEGSGHATITGIVWNYADETAYDVEIEGVIKESSGQAFAGLGEVVARGYTSIPNLLAGESRHFRIPVINVPDNPSVHAEAWVTNAHF